MSRFKLFGVVCALGMVVGMAGVASATDCATDFSSYGSCGSVCSYSGGTVTCTGAASPNEFILFVDGNYPIIYGTVNYTTFCCESSDLGSITSAVPVDITGGGSGDTICLTDSNVTGCSNVIDGVQVWSAAATIDAGSGNDRIVTSPDGTHADDVDAGSGDDVIDTYGGDDTIVGGANDDTIRSGDGNDDVWGGYDDDTIGGGADDDNLWGEGGDDELWGESGDDVLAGDANNDDLFGGTGDDDLSGGLNIDELLGGADADCLCSGRVGVGTNADLAVDTLDGGSGADYCYWNLSEGDSSSNCYYDDNAAADCPCAYPQ
jgi:Ca2+-binding RTX toxin-like protein